MVIICPYCDIEISEKMVEAEDGCCPECGTSITPNSEIYDDGDEENYDDEFNSDIDAEFNDDEFNDEFGDDDFTDDDEDFSDDDEEPSAPKKRRR